MKIDKDFAKNPPGIVEKTGAAASLRHTGLADRLGEPAPQGVAPVPAGPAGRPAAQAAPLLVYNDISGHAKHNGLNDETTPISSPIPKRDENSYIHDTANQKAGKRLFCAIESGMKWNQSSTVRFLTVTSSNESPEDIQGSFKLLVKRIRRTYPQDLIDFGYIDMNDAPRFYEELDVPLKIDYLSLQTSEGNGVIHALTVGDFLPYRWLSNQWKRIHCAWNIDIRAPKKYNNYAFGRYMLKQYLKGQSGILRCAYSQNWIYPGWKTELKDMISKEKQEYGDVAGYARAIAMWDKCMWLHKRPSDLYRCATLSDFGMYEDLSHLEYAFENYRLWKASLEAWVRKNGT